MKTFSLNSIKFKQISLAFQTFSMIYESEETFSSFSSAPTADIGEINRILSSISDVVYLYVKDISNTKEYEETLLSILKIITNIKCIPSPIYEYAKFIEFININKKIITSKEETINIIRLMKASSENKEMHFLLWNFAECFKCEMFIKALKEIAINNDKFYFEMFNNEVNIALFMDHYFITLEFNRIINNDEGMNLKFNLIHIFCKILVDFHEKVNNLFSYQRRIWNYLLNGMKSQSTLIKIESFRAAMHFYKSSYNYFDIKYRYSWLNRMVSATPSDDYLHYFSVKFILKLNFKDFNYVELCKNIIMSNITDVNDFYLIDEILSRVLTQKEQNLDFLLKYLFKTGSTNKIFSGSALFLLSLLLPKYKFTNEIVSWISLFIRRCFQFIVFSSKKKKYHQKRTMVLNFLIELYNMNNDYMKHEIQKYASSLQKCSLADKIVQLKFQMIDNCDDVFIQETQKIKVERVNVKILLDDVYSSIPLIFMDDMDYSYSYSSYSSDYSDSSTI